MGREGVKLKYVPLKLRGRIMDLCHDSDFNMHAGRESTLQDLKSRYHWEGVDNGLKVYLRHCLWCRRAKSVLPRRAGKLQQTLHQHSLVAPGFNFLVDPAFSYTA